LKNIKIAVTGATGLVGSHTCEYLAQKDYLVRAIVRSKINAEFFAEHWANLNIETIEANITNNTELENALAGTEVVIHAAGIVDPYAAPQAINAVNVMGSKLVLETAIKLGVKQFIFISSLSVITGNNDQYKTTENAPLVLCGESYADSKVKAERLVTSSLYKNKIAVTVLRPGFIYGPRERAWLSQLVQAIKDGRALLIDGGKKETNVIYVENLNKAIEASILNQKAYGQIYNLTDGQSITKKQLFDTIADGLGAPRVKKNMPSWLIKPIFDLLSAIVSSLPLEKRRKLSRFSKAAYRLIGINQGFSIRKAQEELQYTSLIPFNIGMIETLTYFKQQYPTSKETHSQKKIKVEIGNRV